MLGSNEELKQMHSEIHVNNSLVKHRGGKHSPSGASSRLPEREKARREKYALVGEGDWLRGEED